MTTPLLGFSKSDLAQAMNRLDFMGGLIATFAPDRDLINVDRTTRRFYYRGARYRDDAGGVNFEPDGFIVCPDASICFVQFSPATGVVQAATLDPLKFAIAECTCAGGLITHVEDLRDMNLITPPGMRWRGLWDSGDDYERNDVVISGPSGADLYICVAANINQEPPDPTYWELIAYGLPDPGGGVAGDAVVVNAGTDGFELGTGGGSGTAFGDVVLVTASLADGAIETGVVVLGKSFALARLTVDAASRVQLYATAAYRTADAGRATTTDPTGEHGCIFDANVVAGNLVLDLMPQPRGSNLDTVRTTDIYYRVENKSGGTAVVTITFYRQVTEA